MPKTRGHSLWRLFDEKKNVYFDNITEDQLKGLFKVLSKSELEKWQVSRHDDPDWVSLSDLQIQKQVSKQITLPKINKTNKVMSILEYEADLAATRTGVTNSARSKHGVEQRKLKRVTKKLPVMIEVVTELLSAHTLDISLTAIKLDQRFPNDFKGKLCNVVIKTPKTINLRCTPLITEKEVIRGKWNVLKIDPRFNLEKLKDFLESS